MERLELVLQAALANAHHRVCIMTPYFIPMPELARGLANYASAEARLLCRKPSHEYEALLGYTAEPEMVHRDNLILSR